MARNRFFLNFVAANLAYLFVLAGYVFAEDIVIVKSHDKGPYEKAIAGFLEGTQQSVSFVNLEKGINLKERIDQKKPRVILSIGAKASKIVADRIADIPVIAIMVSRPESFLEGKKNIAAISLNPSPRDQLALVKKIFHKPKKVGVFYNPKNPNRVIDLAESVAKEMNIELVKKELSEISEVPQALRDLRKETDLLWLVMDETLITGRSIKYIVTFSIEQSYPLIGFSKRVVKGGALATTTSEFAGIGKQAADIAKRILKGESPESIGFVFPEPFGFALSLRSADLLKIDIPEKVKKEASEVYE